MMIESPKSVYIETYGCSYNQAESQIMAGLLEKSGFLITKDENQADVVIVNTCSVKNTTENKILHRLSSFHDNYPDKRLVVAGCLPEADINKVRKSVKNASIIGTNHIRKIPVAVDLSLEGNFVEFVGKIKEEKINLPKIRENEVIDIVPISSGCASFCTFCSTKLAKGNLFSYKEEHIIDEIRNSKVGGGAKEFWLTSQDCGCYGFESGTNSANLIKNITGGVPGTYFIRYGMANPQHIKRMLPELINAYKDGRVFKFVHAPVQSGSENILRKMARGHTAGDFRFVVKEFRKEFPEITVWTDIIVGFPGETEEDFEQSMSLVREVKPDVVNISAYSSRPGTRAAKMKKVETETVKERTRRISLLAKEVYLEQNRRWLGWSGPVLIDEFKSEKNNFIGRNYAYKPVVIAGEHELGQILEVKITEASSMCLFGEEV